MTEERIRNKHGKTVAIIKTYPNGDQSIHDANGKTLGWYTASDNKTRNAQKSILGTGNMLSALITDWD